MKNNGLKYLVIAALLINAATLLFFWLKRSPNGARPPRPAFETLSEELKFTDEQESIFRTLKQDHHRKHDSILQVIVQKRKILYASKAASIDSIAQQIGQLQEEIEMITYHHFEDVKEICQPDQKTTLDSILLRTVQSVLMPRNQRRPPPPDRKD